MYVLQTTVQVLQVVLASSVATNQPQVTTVFYDDIPQETTTLRRRVHQVTSTNNTTDVDVVQAPAIQSIVRNVETIAIHNRDTASITVTVKMDDNGTETILVKQAVAVGETLTYEHGAGWQLLSPITPPFVDTTAIIKGSSDATKLVRIEADDLTTATTRVATMPDANIKLAGHATGLTNTRVPYASGTTGGVLVDSANLTFDGTTLTAHTATIATGDLTVSTGGLVVPDGAAATPSVKVGGEENGLFSHNTGYLGLGSDGTLAATIDGSQRLVVGHTVSVAVAGVEPNLQVIGAAQAAGSIANQVFAVANSAPLIQMAKSRHATKGSHTVVQAGDFVGIIAAYGSDGTTFEAAGSISFEVDGTPGNDDMPGRIVFNTTPDGSNSVAEAMRIDRNQCVGIGNTDPSGTARLAVTESASRSALTVAQGATDQGVTKLTATSGSYAANAFVVTTNTVSGTGFNFLRFVADEDGTPDVEFNFTGNGNATADGSFTGSGADYQEYLESVDGTALQLGATVVLEGDKVRLFKSGDELEDIIGVVRPKEDNKNSAVIGNAAWNRWTDKYLTDDWGRYIQEEYKVYEWEADGVKHSHADYKMPEGVTPPVGAKVTVQKKRKLNPAWDKNATYTPRHDRPEWNLIGMLGQVQIAKGQPVNPRWRKMKDISASVELWFIR